MYLKKALFFFAFCINVCQAQVVVGRITGSDGELVSLANVVVKTMGDSTRVLGFTIARNGYYKIDVKNYSPSLNVEITASKYIKAYFNIKDLQPAQSNTRDFVLLKDSLVKLANVVVKAKVKPFEIRGDTVKYSVLRYSDGSERKIEDVIRKLPGIEVNEKTGEIQYKGKTVETVLLDGDNLFGSNYSVGTRNINADMIEQVQAIENYSPNALLKGIESGDKVALNLTLKKTKTDYSGNLDLGIGPRRSGGASVDVAANLIAVASRYKSFSTLSYNNIGTNNSPFDYFAYNPNPEQLKFADALAKRVIAENFFESDLSARRTNINAAVFGNYNAVFKLNKRLGIKLNLYHLRDKINATQSNATTNYINNQEFTTSDEYNIAKKPVQYRGDVELKWNASKKALLEYTFSYTREAINTNMKVVQNKTSRYDNQLESNGINFKHAFLYTYKLGGKNALQLQANYSSDDAPQNFYFTPAIFTPVPYEGNQQKTVFKKQITDLQGSILGTTKRQKYSVSAGFKIERNDFHSAFMGIDSGNIYAIPGFENSFYYKKMRFYNRGDYKFSYKKWKFSAGYSLSFLHQLLNYRLAEDEIQNKGFLFEPAVSITYKLNDKAGIFGTIQSGKKPFSEEYFYKNPVVISNRLSKNNIPTLELQSTRSLSLFYYLYDLAKQLNISAGINTARIDGNYFTSLNILQDRTVATSFYLPQSNNYLNATMLAEKYIPALQSTLRLNADYTASTYKNIVNGSSLRNNSGKYIALSAFVKSAFDNKINFENKVTVKAQWSVNNDIVAFKNTALFNNLQLLVKPAKRIFLVVAGEYVVPDVTSLQQHYLFLDLSVSVSGKKKLYHWRLTGKNILNETSFTRLQTTDFSRAIFSSNLLPAYIMLQVSRSF